MSIEANDRPNIMPDAEWRVLSAESRHNINVYFSEMQAQIDRLMGVGPGMNPGPYPNCSECGRAMIWQHSGSMPSWMCANCVMCRCQSAERTLASERRHADWLQGKTKALYVAVVTLWNVWPEDVERTFTMAEIKKMVDQTADLRDQRVEDVYARALAGEPLKPASSNSDKPEFPPNQTPREGDQP